MADPQAMTNRPPDTEVPLRAEPPAAGSATGNGKSASSVKALADVLGVVARSNDNTPTRISRNPLAAAIQPDVPAGLRGQFLAHFELLDPIGAGGMAAVIRARDTQLDRIVALKVLPPEMAADPEHVRRFQHESRAAAKLDHENIARVYACGQDQGLLFIAFEYVEGENLRTILDRRGKLPITEAIHYILQVATGLAHASTRGVVHRDIKPSNIIITPSGRAKLVDMGLARSLGPQVDGGLTQSGVTLGTFDYISPEQALEPREADVRSDIYSLGCTFYHMLTGQPPVPEGTAAKKLHHHQHVPPVDPRQLNPAVPDEVAVTLGRMMAKDPLERYQQPEQLVQHLLVLAQRAGAPTSQSDGVLFVDAPLPAPPRMRPAFLMAAAVVLLVSFIVLLGTAPEGTRPPRGNGPRVASKGGADTPRTGDASTTPRLGTQTPTEKGIETPAVSPPRAAEWRTFETAKELADYLERTDVARVALDRDFDLEGTPLIFQGHSLEIKAADPKSPPTLKLTYPARGGSVRWAALTIKGSGSVRLTGLRFVVNALSADIRMAAVAHEGTGLVSLIGCEFVQQNPPDAAGLGRLSAVTIARVRGEGDLPRLSLAECYFAPGQEAVTLSGAADVDATECAFAPHTVALFHVRGRGKQESKLTLNGCSILLAEGPVFRLNDGPACELRVRHSVFARSHSDPAGRQAALIFQNGALARAFDYHGNSNVFHGLSAYLIQEDDENPRTITALAEFDGDKDVTEGERSVEIAESPWKSRDPLALLRQEPSQPAQAFRLRGDVPQLRRTGDSTMAVGVNTCAFGPVYETPLSRPDDRKPEAVAKRKIVDPAAKPGEGDYRTLAEAVAAARSGDEIWIRHNGRLSVDPIELVKPNFELTIQADPKYRPILVQSLARQDDTALFRMYEGKLTLRGLSFQIEALQPRPVHQSLVVLHGAGQCVLQNCLVTMTTTDGLHLAVVTLSDPANAMRMETKSARTHPDVDIHNCFVRGEGDLLAVRTSRPFELEVKNSLIALRTGSVVSVQGGAEDQSTQTTMQLVKLNQVTTYLGEHLLTLKTGQNPKGLLKTDVTAEESLFASAAGKSLIHLEGMEENDQVRGLLAWHGTTQRNVISGFTPVLDFVPKNPDSMLMPITRDQWQTFAKDAGDTFERVRFPKAPAVDASWARAAVSHFQSMAETALPKCGADLEALSKLFDDSGAAAGSGGE